MLTPEWEARQRSKAFALTWLRCFNGLTLNPTPTAYASQGRGLERGAAAAARQGGRQLMDGTTKLGLGIISGVVGIVREPVKGAMHDGKGCW